ncbi:S-methyl-5'-thioadenosine phosphorylase [Porphyrobacter sp. GA68]|uniref:S-methyl-5'-thioadenosine phosphorylase n=1 Tax=Porphyrobacter sp. GA68 TaxID=2883480 RepID=UPI001D18F09A|nr:S-methyl-5'-thioadenosine phosphorylase [Porphyrobacter sp. GA68]
MSGDWTIGIIGGSGIYDLPGLEDAQWIAVSSAWGEPSDAVLCGHLGGINLRFLPRHGRGHRIAPGEVNARANIDALKRAGCTDIVAVAAVGSLIEELPPGSAVLVDQFIDQTKGRPASFFGTGMVAHVSMAEPVCPRLCQALAIAVAKAGGRVRPSGTYVAIEGPQFSTRAESRLYRQWGADVIGMTAMPEARLAREAELPYALLALVTDFDSWNEAEQPVSVEHVVAQLAANNRLAREALQHLPAILPRFREESPIDFALDDAVITAPEQHDPELRLKLGAVARRLFGGM